MMNCAQLAAALSDFLDRRLTEEEIAVVQGHIDECPHCADLFRWEESVLTLVKERCRDTEPLPDGIESRIFGLLTD